MPCDGAWPEEQIGLFKKWMDDGTAPSAFSCLSTSGAVSTLSAGRQRPMIL